MILQRIMNIKIQLNMFAIIFFLSLSLYFLNANAAELSYTPDKLIIKYREAQSGVLSKRGIATGSLKIARVHDMFGCTSQKHIVTTFTKGKLKGNPPANLFILTFAGPVDIKKAANAYMTTGEIEYAEPDYILHSQAIRAAPSDPFFSKQWALVNNGTCTYDNKSISAKVDADMDIDEAWEIEKGDSSVIVAILDSGLKLDSPEFTGRIWKNMNEIPGNVIDDDDNMLIDDYRGFDFADLDTTVDDFDGHGTSVAGVIAANPDNGIGYAGIDWKCKIMVCKIHPDTGEASQVYAASAFYYAVMMGASIINFSQGLDSSTDLMTDAIQYAVDNGVLVVAGAGNDSKDIISSTASIPGVLAVGSSDPDDRFSRKFLWDTIQGSNYGEGLDVVAPGNFISVLRLGPVQNQVYSSGTSLSTAYVSGIASLLLAKNKSLKGPDLIRIITMTAEDQVGDPSEDTPGWDKYHGYGRVNARKALEQASSLVKNIHEKIVIPLTVTAKKNGQIEFTAGQGTILLVTLYSLNGAIMRNVVIYSTPKKYVIDSKQTRKSALLYKVITTVGQNEGKVVLLR